MNIVRTVVVGMRYATMATHSGCGRRLYYSLVTMAIQSEHAHFITKWRTTCNKLYNAVNKRFKSYVRRITKLKCYCTARYKMESIYTKIRLKGQGSLELVNEAQKEGLTIDHFLNVWFMRVWCLL